MLDVTAAEKPTAPKSITIKHLANQLGEQHQLRKRQALKLMEDLISMLTNHLKQGERVKIVGLGILQVRIALPAWAGIRQPASKFRSRPAKKLPSELPKNSRTRSDRQWITKIRQRLFLGHRMPGSKVKNPKAPAATRAIDGTF